MPFRLPPAPALNLALFRITVPVIVLLSPESWQASTWAALSPELRVIPEGLGWAVKRLPTTPDFARVVQCLLIIACVAGLLGICSRAALGIVTLAGLYVFGLSQLSGTVTHDMHLFWFSALLASSPCGDALSLDRLIRARRGAPIARASIAYAAPLQAARVLLGVIYFFPGFWKLHSSGWAWVFSDNLRNQMYWKWYQMGGLTPALRFDHSPLLMRAGALMVILFELSFIALVWSPRLRLLAAAGGLTFHALAEVFMLIPFLSLWGCYTMLIDWGALVNRLRGRSPQLPSDAEPSAARRIWPSVVLGCALVAASATQGARGAMQAWPFACYPTFQWIVGDRIPDLLLEAVRADGSSVALPDGPSTGAARSQQRWGMAWQVAGFYGSMPDATRLRAYLALVRRDPRVLAALRGAVSVRFYAVHYSVLPERFGAPPLDRRSLGELGLSSTVGEP